MNASATSFCSSHSNPIPFIVVAVCSSAFATFDLSFDNPLNHRPPAHEQFVLPINTYPPWPVAHGHAILTGI